jgi:cytochrome c5
MKRVKIIVAVCTLIFTVSMINPSNAQSVQKGNQPRPLPSEVKNILDRSCIGCHSETGQNMAKMKVNFTNWDKYSQDKQASISKKICNEVTKNIMPPKRFLSTKPEATLSDAEKKIICDWSVTLKAAE